MNAEKTSPNFAHPNPSRNAPERNNEVLVFTCHVHDSVCINNVMSQLHNIHHNDIMSSHQDFWPAVTSSCLSYIFFQTSLSIL